MDAPLISWSASRLVQAMREGVVSSREVTDAFIDRIEKVNPTLNAVIWPLFDSAREAARRADRALSAGQSLGPLHGLPVTIKDMFDVEGTPTTAGLSNRVKHRAASDATTVARLRRAGAVVLGKTNVPQMGLYAETDNPVYGRTVNPWNPARSPGGSSGGESALLAACGSPLGLGSDGGGSIRQPCHNCGLFGLKPTTWRLTMRGHWSSANWPDDWAVPGPMARHAEDIHLAMEAMVRPALKQPDLGESPGVWQEPSLQVGRLRIGVVHQFDVIPAGPAARRAVDQTVQLFQDAGCEVRPFDHPAPLETWRTYLRLMYADGLADLRRQLRGAEVDPRIRRYLLLSAIPASARPMLRGVMKMRGQMHRRQVLQWLPQRRIDAAAYTLLRQQVWLHRDRYRRAMERQKVDLVIYPINPVPAWRHNSFDANFSMIYTGLFNLLGVPVGAVPVTRVLPQESSERPESRDAVVRALRAAELDAAGLPMGVQLVAPWWHEDRILAAMNYLDPRLRADSNFPHLPPPM